MQQNGTMLECWNAARLTSYARRKNQKAILFLKYIKYVFLYTNIYFYNVQCVSNPITPTKITKHYYSKLYEVLITLITLIRRH